MPALAQRWLWGKQIHNTPFVVNSHGGYVATDTAGNVYTAGCLGSYVNDSNHIELGGVTSHFGTHSITDSVSGPYYFGQAIITKADANGVFQWAVGTQYFDAGIGSIAADANGNLYVMGVYNNTGTIGGVPLTRPSSVVSAGNGMYFLAKISTAGNVLWAKNIALTAAEEGVTLVNDTSYFDEFHPYGGIALDGGGNCYMTGLFIDPTITIGTYTLTNNDPSGFTTDMFVAKFDPSGTAMWAKKYGSNGSDIPIAPAVTKNGNTYLAGSYHGDSSISFGATTLHHAASLGTFIVQLDNSGNAIWATSPDSEASITSMATDTPGNVYITGAYYTDSINFGSGELVNYSQNIRHGDVFLARYESSGSVAWAADGGGPYSAGSSSVTTDQCGNVFIAGNIANNDACTIYFHGVALNVPAPVLQPMFIAAFDQGGNYTTGVALPDGGYGGITPLGITADNRGNLLASGEWSSGNFVFGSDNIVADSGERFMFIAKLQYDSTGCLPYAGEEVTPVPELTADILLFPNPAQTQITIASNHQPINQVTITNLLGQQVKTYSGNHNGMLLSISVEDLPSGIYLVKINGTETRKFVKE